MLQLIIFADDFTGALDTGVQFSKLGIRTKVTTDIQLDFSDIEENIRVLLIDTESRYRSYSASYELMHDLVQKARRANIPYIYKKIDSALRGNISSEIKAIWDVYQDVGVSVIPAFPAVNRTVQNGILYIDGVPVSESVFGKDPYEPVTESNIVTRLKNEADLSIQLVSHEDHLTTGSLYLFDASTESELLTIGESLHGKGLMSVTVGCAGFASILATTLFDKEGDAVANIESPTVVICGSLNPITQAQVEYAKKLGYPTHSLNGGQLTDENYWQTIEGQKKVKTYLSEVTSSNLLVVETFEPTTREELSKYVEDGVINHEDLRFRVGKSLGALAYELVKANPQLSFLFTGGDTLFQSMKVFGIKDLEPQCEVSPGVVLSQMNVEGHTVQVMTKSGGLGHRELLEDLVSKQSKEKSNVSRL